MRTNRIIAKTILKASIVFLGVIILFGCSDDKTALDGKWKEFWAVGEKSNVDHTDIYEININSDEELVMNCFSCNETPTRFQKILFDGNELSFEIVWENNTVPYVLRLQDNNTLVGTAINAEGNSVKVKLQKVE